MWWDWLCGGAAVVVDRLPARGRRRLLGPQYLAGAWDVFFGVRCRAAPRGDAPHVGLDHARGLAGFLAYALVGPWLPGPWTHRGYDVGRLVGLMYQTLEGIFGTAVDVSSSLIILFTIYGAFLQYSGAGKFFLDWSFAAMGGKPTGPAARSCSRRSCWAGRRAPAWRPR